MKKNITTPEELEKLIDEYMEKLDNLDDISLDEIKYNLKPIVIKISDSGYDSSIGTSLMEPIIELQSHVYDMVKLVSCENTKARLYEEEKKRFEIFVKIEKGSSIINIDLNPVLEKAVGLLNGDRIFSLLVIGILAYSGVSMVKIGATKIADYKNKVLEAKEKREYEKNMIIKSKEDHEHDENMLSRLGEVISLINGANDTSCKMMSNLAKTDGNIYINGENISQTTLEQASAAKKSLL